MSARDIAILMYHHVKPGPDMVNVQPEAFADQIKTLAENGVKFLSWADFLALNDEKNTKNGRNSRKGVLVTFDDGFLDNYWYAYPVLKQYSVPFVLFITPDRMPEGDICREIGSIPLSDHRSYARKHTISDQFVNRAELMDMVNSGLCELGAHTLVHWRCENHDERTRHEIAASKTAIEGLTNQPCDTFAWPYGQTQAESLAWAKEVGYKGIFTTEHGLHAPGDDMFQIKRFNVKDKPGDYLMARLNLHWMPLIGRLYARIKGIVALTFIASLSIAFAVFATPSANADVLYMRNNTILFGIIEKDLGDQYQLAISKGDITVPKKNIRRIEYDYKARFTALEADDLQGHLELGEFCVKKGLLKEAAEQYEYVTTLEGFPPYVHKTLGDLYMELEDYNKAYVAYDQYVKKTKRKDKELAQKMAKANKLRQKASNDLKQSQPDKEAGAEEGFEQYATWTVEKWGNPCAVLNQTIDDNKLLRVDFQSGGKDKTAIGYPLNGDISDKTKLTFSVFNNQELPMQIALAFVTNPGWGWHESKSMQIQPKWNVGTELNLTGNDFKSEATKWTFTTPILNKKNVKKIFFLIYNGKKDGTFFIDDIKLE